MLDRNSSESASSAAAADPDDVIFDLRGIDLSGVVVVARPDRYMVNALLLTATGKLVAFFDPIGCDAARGEQAPR